MFKVSKVLTASLILMAASYATVGHSKVPAKMGGLRLPAIIGAQMTKAKKAEVKFTKDDDCQDFSGNWAGTCTDGDDTYDDNFTVDQDRCHDLYVNETNFPMGGVASLGQTSSTDTFSMNLYPQWSPSMTAFNFRVTYSGRGINQDLYYSGRGFANWQIIDGKLVSRNSSEVEMDLFGQITVSHFTDECTYTKQN